MTRSGALLALAGVLCMGCSDEKRPPGLLEDPSFDAGGFVETGGASFDVGGDTGVSFNCSGGEDAGVCACKEVGQKPTSLYVVLDRSGSMAEIGPEGTNKWDAIRFALLHAKTGVLRALGGRIAVGVALFPGPGADACSAGKQVFPLATGSQATYDTIAKVLAAEKPAGATPTAPSLVALAPTIKALPKPAYVLLATDGAPNCGTTPCGIDRCSYNIERVPLGDGKVCDSTVNCCDPSKVSGGLGWGACVDADGTKAAVADLAAAGVKTFVFGAPGTSTFAADLDELAKAGGTAREGVGPGDSLYYRVDTTTQAAFAEALAAVAAKLLDSCVVTLESPPEEPGITNVLVDGALVPQDETDGWRWTDDGRIELRGKTCERVTKGTVSQVQVAVGCKTVTK